VIRDRRDTAQALGFIRLTVLFLAYIEIWGWIPPTGAGSVGL